MTMAGLRYVPVPSARCAGESRVMGQFATRTFAGVRP